MANLRAIRTRIKSVENTRQITKSMKMVAAAKLRKTQAAFASLRSYADESRALLETVSAAPDAGGDNPYLQPHAELRKTCYVLVVGNRGLCGTYNQALLRFCEQRMREDGRESSVITCGRWGKDMIAAAGITVDRNYEISDAPTHEEALELTEELKRRYREGEADEIVFVYQHYRTVLSQVPDTVRLLPLERPEGKADENPVIFEPDRETVLDSLLDLYIGNTVHALLLEARTGEHSARMTAMTAAADNTEELIRELTLELNHARQAAITTEISEIAGGAEALRNNTAGG
ncbi:MAG: ATP synthase F1 subunit gamma [Oscillospiraceae bacterium]|nr:ATP synthase F1 subunit gamma [Oscillospiraceae bacterium]